ncbi:unnamed protein product [Ilex paraguariensis]|uniref:Uncharacterized protein n=1 Tax=Ilex paraguariensis TaxID=185542 RepID=A0ABC8TR21_9AQUA
MQAQAEAMAQFSIYEALVIAFIVAVVTVFAQDSGMALAASPDAGATFSRPIFGVVIETSLIVLFFLFRH